MAKGNKEMRADHQIFVRLFIDKESSAVLDQWAAAEHRTKAAQMGFLLKQLARLRRDNPDALREAGLMATPPIHARA